MCRVGYDDSETVEIRYHVATERDSLHDQSSRVQSYPVLYSTNKHCDVQRYQTKDLVGKK